MPTHTLPRPRSAVIALALVTALPLSLAHAQAPTAPTIAPGVAEPAAPAPAQPSPAEPAAPAPAQPSPAEPAAPAPSGRTGTLPTTAAGTLDRAASAYEFGDIQQMVDLARLVSEGAFPASDEERAVGHRLLGLGLYLSGRPDRAEAAFVQLFRLDPRARLDRATTRPDAVAFFEDVRRRHKPKKVLAYNLLPPFGQLQNGTPVRGWVIVGAGLASFGVLAGTYFKLKSLEIDHNQSTDHDLSERLKTVNFVAAGALAATYLIGVVDGLIGYAQDDAEPRLSFGVSPGGAQLTLRF
jgi:hypothetical protein